MEDFELFLNILPILVIRTFIKFEMLLIEILLDFGAVNKI
jgi:hypothetical protein